MWSAFYLTGVLASLIGSVYYSINGRRREMHPLEARMTLGKMNMSLGVLLLLFGINQYTYEPLTTVRVIVGLMFLLVGLFNFIKGSRNFLTNRREWMAYLKKES